MAANSTSASLEPHHKNTSFTGEQPPMNMRALEPNPMVRVRQRSARKRANHPTKFNRLLASGYATVKDPIKRTEISPHCCFFFHYL